MTKSRQSREWHSLSPCFVGLKIREQIFLFGVCTNAAPPQGGRRELELKYLLLSYIPSSWFYVSQAGLELEILLSHSTECSGRGFPM